LLSAGWQEKILLIMYAAIPTPIRELSTLASNHEGCLKDFMNHFVELTSAHQWFQRCSRDLSREHNPESFGSRNGLRRQHC
jgi:hypothetical protein